MIWSAKTNWDLTSDNLIKTNTLRGNPESRFKIPDFGQNTQSMDESYRANEKRSVDFWTDMLSDDFCTESQRLIFDVQSTYPSGLWKLAK